MSTLINFLASGKLKRLLTLDKHLKILREKIRQYQDAVGIKRIEWLEQEVVGKYMNFRKYEYNEVELKEFLDERGLLPVVATVRWGDLSVEEKKILEPNKISVRVNLKFTPNSEYSLQKNELEEYKLQLNELEIGDLVWQWKEKKHESKSLERLWSRLCLNPSNVKPDGDEYKQFGSFLERYLDPGLDAVQVYKSLDKETFKKHCKIKNQLVINYGLKGFYTINEVRKYRRLIDIQTRYYLIEFDEERRALEMLENRLRGHSTISQIE